MSDNGRPPITQAEVDRFTRFFAGPSSLADWYDHRDAYPGPYRIPADQAALMVTYVRLRRSVLDMARVAPWLKPRGVSL